MGLDFGTSGTKVSVRNQLEKGRPVRAVDFGTNLAGFSRFSLPSTVAVDSDRVFFGQEAERRPSEAKIFRSLKVDLINPQNKGTDDLPLADLVPTKELRSFRPRPEVAEFLSTLYVAHVMQEVRRLLEHVYPGLSDKEVLWNLDVPIDALGESKVERRYWRILDVAMDCQGRVGQARQLGELHQLWVRCLQERAGTQIDPKERRAALVPEAVAVIQGAGVTFDPRRDLYNAIIDIGAGTADIGWFKLVKRPKQKERLPFFHSKTGFVGCDAIDRKLAHNVWRRAPAPDMLAQVRGAKFRLAAGEVVKVKDGSGRPIRLEPDRLEAAAVAVGEEIFAFYHRTFGPAYEKEKNTDRWEKIRCVVVGGGSLVPALADRFRKHPRRFGKGVEMINVAEEVRVDAIGGSQKPSESVDAPFLLTAIGLSYPVAEMPRLIGPDEIKPLDHGPSGPTGVYDYQWDEL